MYLQYKKIVPFYVYHQYKTEDVIVLSINNLVFSLFCLKNHISYKFNILSFIAGIDLLGLKYRFCVIYDLLSIFYNKRLRLKIFLDETTFIFSVTSIFVNANWWEREIWDFYGIYFENHPDLRRILTDYGFEGYPMRKDFPLYGYLEVRYDDTKKRVVLEPVELSQEFRTFNFESPW